MFGPLGVPELIFILLLALLIFGPRKLPEIGRTLGRGMAEFRRASSELKRSFDTEVLEEERRATQPAVAAPRDSATIARGEADLVTPSVPVASPKVDAETVVEPKGEDSEADAGGEVTTASADPATTASAEPAKSDPP